MDRAKATTRRRGGQGAAAGPVTVSRIGESAWILRPTAKLQRDMVGALRDVFLEVVDAGAENVVVDLSGVDTVAPSGAETILAMADLMRGRSGMFWLAARSSDNTAHTLRAIDGPKGVLGVSAALDTALERLPPESQTIAQNDRFARPSETLTHP